MALPRTELGLVDPLAAGVTKPTLLSFPRFMRCSGSLRLGPAMVMLAAVASAFLLFLHAPIARAQCGGDASAAPCPTPVNAFMSLDVTAGDANTVINVTGGQFLPNEQLSLYWDQPNKVAGAATADASGSFNTRVKPFSGDAPGVHRLCASVAPNPCANFSINAPSTSPSPSPSPSASPSASPDAIQTVTPLATPVASTLNGFDVISKPPFVFLPIAGAMAIALALAYWLFSVMRRPKVVALPSAAVVHRATRPDYSAGFGTPPPSTPEAPVASAWPEAAPASHPTAAEPPPAAETPPAREPELPAVEWGPPVEWGTGNPDWGYPELSAPDDPPELPEHGETAGPPDQ